VPHSALPLAAFMVGPLLWSFARDALTHVLLYWWLPTVLTLTALGLVLVFVFARTRSVARAIAFAGGSPAIALFEALVYMLAVWPTGS
jgi:hypothetical protein